MDIDGRRPLGPGAPVRPARRARRGGGRWLAAAVAGAALLAACGDDGDALGGTEPGGGTGPDAQLISSLERFDSCDELRGWARDELAPRIGAHATGGPGGPVIMEDGDGAAVPDSPTAGEVDESADRSAPGSAGEGGEAAPAPSSGADTSSAGAAPQAPDHSGTNVQVEGVDEPDVVKTDGERILALAEGEVHLISAGDRELQDSVDLPDDVHGGEMLLAGDRVLVFAGGRFDDPDGSGSGGSGSGGDAATRPADRVLPEPAAEAVRAVQVDIDGGRLSVAETFQLDGSYVSARLTGDVVRLVVRADPVRRLPFVAPAGPGEDAEARAREVNRQVVEDADPEDLLPRWRRLDAGDEVVEEGTLVTCEQAHAPETFAGFGMVAVVSIDVSEGLSSGVTAANGAGVMADGQTVYSSAESLYVAAPQWVDWRDMSADERASAEQDHGTDIHRFDISDPDRATYEMSGRVDGSLLNQFALDEHDGHLRVATTSGAPWAEGEGESESHVVVLEPREGGLTEVGSVSGLGPGETIHAVRFMGDVGFVITFEQTDPLFTIDLSTPAEPRMIGELEMLGYSAYLHPVGEGKLVGVGQDADAEGVTQGAQVSLFDVSDLSQPERVAQATIPDARSSVESDHRAFLWWAETGLLAVPVDARHGRDGSDRFTGIVGYTVDVDGDGLDELGRVSHPPRPAGEQPPGIPPRPLPEPMPVEPDGGAGTSGDPGRSTSSSAAVPSHEPGERAEPILRSLVIGDDLWTLSSHGLQVNDLETLEEGTFIDLAET